MTGQQPLIALRRAGKKPACVWVHDDDWPMSLRGAREWHTQPNPFTGKVFAELHIAESDMPETLDLRCLVGLQVHLMSDRGDERARRMFNAIANAEPSLLVAVIAGEVVFHGGSNG